MNSMQKLIKMIVPAKWFAPMEQESRQWMIHCTCGHERSIWEAGGIRYKAIGNPKQFWRCNVCGQWVWHQLYKKEE